MAKAGGTLTADTNAEVMGADLQRQSVLIHNLETTSNHKIYVEFGTAASTTTSDGSFEVDSGENLELHVENWPEIRGTINLKGAGTYSYIVRTSN